MSSPEIFINFRVGDGQDSAVLVDQKLCRIFGTDTVFRSSRSIPGSAMFEAALLEAIASCSEFLVVIGPNWLAQGPDGTRRIDAPADWVRVEIEVALAHDKAIIPILVGDIRMPAESELPPTINSLPGRQYIRLHHRNAELDLIRIADEVGRILDTPSGISMPKPTEPVLLTSLPAIQRSADVGFGAAHLNGRFYGDSIIYRCDLFANATRGSVSFNLGRNYRQLHVTAGVLDDATDATQVGVFQVVVDDTVKAEASSRHGQPRTLRVDVTDALRLRLVAYRPGTTESPLMAGARLAGGLSNHLPELGWGNPILHP